MNNQPDNKGIPRRVFLKSAVATSIGSIHLLNLDNAIASADIMPLQDKSGFILPALPYGYDALEPHIDATTMQIHHDKHHGAYVSKLNASIEKEPSLKGKTLEELFSQINSLPASVQSDIRNHGGGHWNHTFFWDLMTPKKDTRPSEKLKLAVSTCFGSWDNFIMEFDKTAMGVFGSGWAWLIAQTEGKLAIIKTPNQDNPLMEIVAVKARPLLGVDVWEHAYYLKYQNRRADYLKAFWNVVNWEQVSKNFG